MRQSKARAALDAWLTYAEEVLGEHQPESEESDGDEEPECGHGDAA